MSKQKKSAAVSFSVSKPQAIEKVAFRMGERRESAYDAIYQALEKLEKGQVVKIPVPTGIETQVLHNRLQAALQRGPVQPPKGCVFRKRTTEDGQIAICCIGEFESTSKNPKMIAKAASRKKKAKVAKAEPATETAAA